MTQTEGDSHLIVRHAFDAAELAASCPPRFRHPHKNLVYKLACPPGAQHRGSIVYTRWRAMPLPEAAPAAAPAREVREDVFGYEQDGPAKAAGGVVEWYLNFADPHLFVAYAGSLLAQDELQVLEHPALGSVREWLSASADPRDRPLTEENGEATPVLLRGVPRRCAFATDPDLLEGRPLGLYGNRFARAKEDAIRAAVTVLDPPTISNILAMAAPPGGSGAYTMDEIRAILVTAYTGFRAARLESGGSGIVVHTGHWGTGAFGGNKVLMTMLQLFAAQLAGVAKVVFHAFDAAGAEAYRQGEERLSALVPPGATPRVEEILRAVTAMGFIWGVSDGN